MALYPGATKRLLPQNSTQPRITPISVIYHTAVSTGTSLYNFFNGRSSGVESHFYVTTSGKVEQYIDTSRRADCQRDGNRYGISIETQDNGASNPNSIIPWSPAQLTALVDLTVWLCKTHNIPPTKCTRYNGPGLGYHALFTGTPGWNTSHACPAKNRIAQFPVIVSRVAAAVKGGATPPAASLYIAFPGAAYFKASAVSDTIGRMNMRLRALKFPAPASRTFDAASRAAYASWQRSLKYTGSDADGIPGESSWDALRVAKTGALPPVPAPPKPPAPPAPPKPTDPNQERYEDLMKAIQLWGARVMANVDDVDRRTQEALKQVDDKIDALLEQHAKEEA